MLGLVVPGVTQNLNPACGRADAAATRIVVRSVRAGNRGRKFGSSVHSEIWQLSHADAGVAPLLLRHAATERPNSTLLFAAAWSGVDLSEL